MDIKRLRYFCTIVEQSQISRAAKLLNIAQPALSQRLKELEDELNTALIIRQERKWQLTPAGEFLYEKARQLLNTFDQLPFEIKTLDEASATRLHIGAAPICFSYVSKTIAVLLQKHPGMRFRLYHGDVSSLEEWMDERLIDLALCRRPKNASHYTAIPLPPRHFVAVYPAALLPHHTEPSLRIEDLHRIPLLISRRRRSGGIYEDLVHLFLKYGKEPHFLVESMGAQTLLQLLDQGVSAAAILPDSEVGPEIHGRYCVKPLDEPKLKIQTYLVHRKNLKMIDPVHAFIDALLQKEPAPAS